MKTFFFPEQGRTFPAIKYYITADAKPGPIGKIPHQVGIFHRLQIRPRSKSSYQKRGQDLLSVDQETGVISLKTQPKRLFHFARNQGIHELDFQIISQRKYSRRISKKVNVRLVIVRAGFGDTFLNDVGKRIRSGNLVRRSETFRNPRNALHRFLRIIAERVDPVGFARAFSAIKEEWGVKSAERDVVKYTENGKWKPGKQIFALSYFISRFLSTY